MNFAMKIANNKQSNHVFEVTFQFRLHGENCVIYHTDTLNGTVKLLLNRVIINLWLSNFLGIMRQRFFKSGINLKSLH